MDRRNDHMAAHPFLYVGLLLIAMAVVSGLLSEHPQASDVTAVSLDLFATICVICGLGALLLAPLFKAMRHKN